MSVAVPQNYNQFVFIFTPQVIEEINDKNEDAFQNITKAFSEEIAPALFVSPAKVDENILKYYKDNYSSATLVTSKTCAENEERMSYVHADNQGIDIITAMELNHLFKGPNGTFPWTSGMYL